MQAIQTRYIGPTNTRGSRIKATAAAGSLSLPYDHSLNADDNHARAAFALSKKYAWVWALIAGDYSNGDRVFVTLPRSLAPHAYDVQCTYWTLRDMLSVVEDADGRRTVRNAITHLVDANPGLF